MEPYGTHVNRPPRLTKVLRWACCCLLVIAAAAPAQEASEDAYLVAGGRLGNLIALGESIAAVEGRFADVSPAPIAFPGFTVYAVRIMPPVLIAACDATGEVFHAELQHRDGESLKFATAQGVGMASSEADIVTAYGEPEEVREGTDDLLLLYPDQGLAFMIDRASRGVLTFATFKGDYMRCP